MTSTSAYYAKPIWWDALKWLRVAEEAEKFKAAMFTHVYYGDWFDRWERDKLLQLRIEKLEKWKADQKLKEFKLRLNRKNE